ncbi:hypothetical protein TorRG33x02_117720, partial [Trema orientale]
MRKKFKSPNPPPLVPTPNTPTALFLNIPLVPKPRVSPADLSTGDGDFRFYNFFLGSISQRKPKNRFSEQPRRRSNVLTGSL